MHNPPSWLQRRLDRSTPDGLELTASLAIAGLLLAAFAGILQGTHETNTVAQFDQAIGRALIAVRDPLNTAFFEVLSGIAGIKGTILFLMIAASLLFRRRYRQLPVVLIAGAAVSTSIVLVVKLLVARPRPDMADRLVREASFRFPSGHTMAAVVIFGLTAYFIARTFDRVAVRTIIGALWVLFVVLVAMSRIYLGVHYPSDTLASAFLGLAGLSLGLAWLSRHESSIDPLAFDPSSRLRLIIALVATAAIVAVARPFFI